MKHLAVAVFRCVVLGVTLLVIAILLADPALAATSIHASGPAVGGDVELFAADAGIATALALVTYGLVSSRSGPKRDYAFEAQLTSLRKAIDQFCTADDILRTEAEIDALDKDGHDGGRAERRERSEVQLRKAATNVVSAAYGIDMYGNRSIAAVKVRMAQLGLDFEDRPAL